MATIESLRMDVKGLLAEATRSGKAAVSRKLSEAEASGQDNAGANVLLLGAVEVEGGRLIGAMIPSYRAFASFEKAKGAGARTELRRALESYLVQAAHWGQLHPAFGGVRPVQDIEPMRDRLRGKLELEASLVDSAPRPRVWKPYAVALVILLALGAAAFAILPGYFIHR